MKTSSTSKKSNQTYSLFKLALFSTILGISVLTTACSDNTAKDDSQSQTQDAKSSDKSDDNNQDSQNETDKTVMTDDDKKKKEIAAIPVEVVSVVRGDIQQTYRTITTLEAEQEAQVVARSTGILQNILVEEGDMVVKGQLLAQLDVEQLTLEVAQKEATLKKLNRELNRQQSLYKRKLTSSDALDRATYEFQSQQAQYKLSKLKLAYASIKAPISGIVTERLVKTGNLIRENDLLFKIVDLSSLIAVLHLPEKEMANIKKGQDILLNIDALDNQIIVGKIERIRPSIDTDTGTFKVVAAINNDNSFLKSGMFGKVEVVFDVHQNSLILQQQAVITQDNRSHVFVVKGDKAIQTPVIIGFRYNGFVEVLDGLAESDQVITTGQQILKHESKIEVVGQDKQQLADKQSDKMESPSSIAMNP